MSITDRQADYVAKSAEFLKNQGVRAETDLRNEKVGFKIREHTLQRVPYLLVAGDKEVAAGLVSVRTRSGKDLGTMSLQSFVDRLRVELDSRGRLVLLGRAKEVVVGASGENLYPDDIEARALLDMRLDIAVESEAGLTLPH